MHDHFLQYSKSIAIVAIFLCFYPACQAMLVAEQYVLVNDKRNSFGDKKKDKRGTQGRILDGLIKGTLINEALIPAQEKLAQSKTPWRYVIALSCKRGSRSCAEIVQELTNVLPESERHRLAVILCVNEKITVDQPANYDPALKEILSDDERLMIEECKIPVLLLYVPWTAFRESETGMSADVTRKAIWDALKKIKKEKDKRAYEEEVGRIRKEDEAHGFPCGPVRTMLLQYEASRKFIDGLHGNGVSVYVQTQDADFIDLQEKPVFYNFGDPVVVKDGTTFLFKRFDELIQHHYAQQGCLPIVVGGSYVFSHDEDTGEKRYTDQQKWWSRFAVEMSNMLKQIIGQYAPYGLYFSEANTLLLAPLSVQRVYPADHPAVEVMDGDGIIFGPFCEMEGFTRELMKCSNDQQKHMAMVYSAQPVLATSMKRSAKDRQYALRFGGEFDNETKMFSNWDLDDVRAIHGMSQGIVSTRTFAGIVATGFANHRVSDARSILMKLFNLFDPYAMAINRMKWSKTALTADQKKKTLPLWTILRTYAAYVASESSVKTIKECFGELRAKYNHQEQGDLVRFYILSLVWECGQCMRIMYVGALDKPDASEYTLKYTKEMAATKTDLALRLNYAQVHGSPAPNEQVLHLLGLDKVPYPIEIKEEKKAAVLANA